LSVFVRGFKMSGVTEPLPSPTNDSNPSSEISTPPVPTDIPWITYTVIVICSVIFAYLNLAAGTSSYDGVTSILIPSCVEIWHGAYWGLVTTAFVHMELWHILFNMWWTKDFGRVLEGTMGRGRYTLFIIGAAVVGSGTELAFSGQTGIGFSGVLYALFGYGLVARQADDRLRRIINKQTVQWLLGWLVLCMVLTAAKVWNVANGAHLGGFLFGCLVASAFVLKKYVKLSYVGLAVLLAVAIASAVYAPWSPYWKDRQYWSQYLDAEHKAKAGDPAAQFLYCQFIAQQPGKRKEAVTWLRKSAEQKYLPSINGLAWVLATDTNNDLRDGAQAVKWAEQLCKEDGWKSAAYLDTLAAAYAELDRWDEAVATQQKAIAALTAADASIKEAVESRLQKYLRREKVRE
jgi:membrane associated rhomboid family serine protease